MKPWVRWAGAALIVGGYAACSPKKFAVDDGCENVGQSCVTVGTLSTYKIDETIQGGKVDILVVDDNSASMSFEQANLGNRFSGFIQNLENKKMQYRIGVLTTDVSASDNAPRTINKNGALQDGRLIAFPGGASYLQNSSGDITQKDAAFKAVIQRPETLSCEQFIKSWKGSIETQEYTNKYYQSCPSGDERGIYALNQAVEGGASGLIRNEANLAVIVLADEDVRSGLYCAQWSGSTCVREGTGGNYRPRAEKDKAASFIALMKSKYPAKKYAVHSIIVRSSTCLSQQNAQTSGLVSGSYGTEYGHLSNGTGGMQGDICSPNYATLLQDIFNNIESQILDKIALACENPKNLTLTLNNNSDPTIAWSVVGKEIHFNKKLPVGVQALGSYQCDAL